MYSRAPTPPPNRYEGDYRSHYSSSMNVYETPRVDRSSSSSTVNVIRELENRISELEHKINQRVISGWKCPMCGKVHSPLDRTCECTTPKIVKLK